MTGLEFLIAPCLAFVAMAASPGPATLAVAATSMASGRRHGVMLGFGLAIGLAAWGIVAALGLGALMLSFAPAMIALRLLGGAYLLLLAWRSAQSALSREAPTGHAITESSGARLFRRGLFLNLMNPKAVLAWTAVIAIGLPEGGGALHLATIVAACLCAGFIVNLGYAYLFSTNAVMAAYARARRGFDTLFALFFAGAGLKLIFSRTEAP